MCNQHKIINKNLASECLPKRDDCSNKYTFGHTLIIGGSRKYFGAPILAVKGSFATGAGMVSLCVPKSIYETVVKLTPLETIVFPVEETTDGTFSPKSIEQILDYISNKKVTTLCIGCGMDRNEETKQFVNNLLELIYNPNSIFQSKNIYSIIDADAVVMLKIENKKIVPLKETKKQVILTPHIGEYCKLTGKNKEILKENPCVEISNFCNLNNIITILKDSITTISDGEHIFKTNTPNSSLAKAGSGDVLAGMLAGFVYQIDNFNKKTIRNFVLH